MRQLKRLYHRTMIRLIERKSCKLLPTHNRSYQHQLNIQALDQQYWHHFNKLMELERR